MTLIHGGSTAQRGRPEDSTALQKRLLQDLERQWLDTWGRADQVQAQAAPPDGKAAPADDPTLSAEKAGIAQVELSSLRANSVAMSAPRELPGVANAPQAASARASEVGGVLANGVSANLVGDHRVAMSGTAPSLGTGDARLASDVSVRNAPAPSGERQWQSEGSGSSGIGRFVAVQAPDLQPPPAHDKGDQERAVHAAAAGWTASPGNAVDHEASTGIAATAPVSTAIKPATTPAFTARPSMPSAQAKEDDAEAAKASPRRMWPTGSEQKATQQHLMLREISEQEVLASMRDAQLGSHESQLAAQGLARALMQAGYARVQVVVNGHQQLQDAPKEQDDMAQGATRRSESTASETSNSQSVRHGNQH
ncbi:hypothetical protein [Roseateles sp. P5_E4]